VGNTQYSIATVLTTFMGGLALGSWLGGRYIDRKNNPLFVYALLEAAIGVYCFLVPYLVGWSAPLFKWIYVNYQNNYAQASGFRFLVCSAILLVPTTFMGATLPVLSKFTSNDSDLIGKDVGTLYGINTFGAVAGALTSAFVFMRLWGLMATIQIAAFLNLAIAACVLIWFRDHRVVAHATPVAEPQGDVNKWIVPLILLCFGFSGLSAMVYQVAWNRIFSLLLGSSVYAFSLILTIFILGLAFGTVIFSRISGGFKDLPKVFGILQVAIGVSALLALPLFGEIPFVNRWVYKNWGLEFSSIQRANFLIIFSLLFVPTFFMGAQFPVVVRAVARNLASVGSHVGSAYSSNTIGTIFGSFLGGFVLIPWLGVQNTVICAVLLNVGLGVALLFLSRTISVNIKMYALPMIFIICLLSARSLPPWDKAVISSGSFMPYRLGDLEQAVNKTNKILFFKEGLHTTVTTELGITGNIFLRVNGKTDASLALDMRTQLLSGYLPMFLHGNPGTALVIGQGSGITLGAAEQFPVKQIDLVEISETVIEGSRYFSPFNHHALDDKRLSLILEDGRNHIALSDKKYDVIISEPSNPWISGVGALFTRDFFAMAKTRLNPGGVLCIWVHTNMSPDNFKSVTKTFSDVFPFVTMWESIVGDDYLLIGSERQYHLSYEEMENFFADKDRSKDLRGIGVNNMADLMSLMIMSRDGLLKFSSTAPIHTDDNALLEFSAPEYIYKDERDILVRQIAPFVKVDPGLLRFDDSDSEVQTRVRGEMAAVQRSESQIREIKRKARVDQLLDKALDAFRQNENDKAEQLYKDILEIDPENVMTWLNLGNVYASLQQYPAAEEAYNKSITLNPYYLFGYIALAKLYISTGSADRAKELLLKTLAWQKADKEVRLYLGIAYSMKKDMGNAFDQWNKALELDPQYALVHYYMGIQYQNTDPAACKRHLSLFLDGARRSGGYDERLVMSAEKLLKKF
jgi:spermidine synthase